MNPASQRASWGFLVVALAIFAVVAPEPLNSAVVAAKQGGIEPQLRLGIALFPVISALVVLCLAERLSPGSRRLFLWAGAAALFLSSLDVLANSLDPDEPAHLFQTYQISQGKVPYRDFFAIRHFFFHLFLTPLMRVMDGDLRIFIMVRVLMLAFFLGALVVASKLAKLAGGRSVGVFLFLPSSALFVWGSIEFRGDPPVTMLCLLAVWFLFKERPVLGGCLLGLAFLILQKAAIYGFAIGLGCLLAGIAWKRLALFTASSVGISLLYPLWALSLGIWDDYFVCAFRSSAGFAQTYVDSAATWVNHLVLSVQQEFLVSPATWFLAAFGSALLLRKSPSLRSLPLMAVSAFFLLWALNLGWKNYMLFGMALMGILATVGWSWFPHKGKGLVYAIPDVVALLVVSLGLLNWAAVPPPGMDLSRAEFMLKNIPQGESVYSEIHYAHPIFRHNASYYGNAQLRYSQMIGDSGPRGNPANLSLLLEGPPPGAIVIRYPDRRKDALELLQTKGWKYEDAGMGIYLRVEPPLEAKSDDT